MKHFYSFFLFLFFSFYQISAQSFDQSELDMNGFDDINGVTSLMYGPDGRLYVAEYPGLIKILTIQRNSSTDYIVTDVDELDGIQTMEDHNDDGSTHNSVARETTGLTVAGTAQNPVIYVASSDFRIGAGSGGGNGDVDLDTNSGVITRFSWNGSSWDVVDLVRGLPRSEENHATNGLEFVTVNGNDYLIVASGGITNGGAPSTNFVFTCEYALSGAVLSVDLTALNALTPSVDNNGRSYIYDLPTLDDPTRANANGIEDPDVAGYDGIDVNDPWGGNDGLNQAMIVSGGPVQIFSPGYRNAYDLVVTESGAVYVTDNGANGGWGGFPVNEGMSGATTNAYDPAEPGSSSSSGGEQVNNEDHLQLVTTDIQNYTFGSLYGGHPNPTRANPDGAGLYTDGTFRTLKYDPSNPGPDHTDDQSIALPANWPPVSVANIVEGDWRGPGISNPDGPDDDPVTIWDTNTNGIDEYTASNFGGAMQGNLIAGHNGGNLHRVELNGSGGLDVFTEDFLSGIGGNALGVTCNGDSEIFPGTIWAGTLNAKIVVFEPVDFVFCLDPSDPSYNPLVDYDGDGYTNQDEEDSGTDSCNGGSQPSDFDKSSGGTLISDLNDTDDDFDGIPDGQDPFQLGDHTQAGSDAFTLPISNALFNDQQGLGGIFGLGMTGLMNNGDTENNWLNWLDDRGNGPNPDDVLGGAPGIMTSHMTSGTANGVTNTQEKGYQYGVQVDNTTGVFTVTGGMNGFTGPLRLYGNTAAVGGELGLFMGDGTQSNFIKFVVTTDGFTALQEINDVPQTPIDFTLPIVDRPSSGIELHFVVDPATGNVDLEYQIDGGTRLQLGSITAQGNVLTALQDSTVDLAVGFIGTSGTPGVELEGSWDYLNVIQEEPYTILELPDLIKQINAATDFIDLDDYFGDNGGNLNLTYTIEGNTNPSIGASISTNQLQLTYPSNPAATTITVRATDTDLLFVEQSFQVEINTALYRINGGGAEVTHNGDVFSADSNFVGGGEFTNTSATVSPLFQSEHNSPSQNFSYNFTLPNGDYEINLYFAEIYWGANGGGSGGNGKRVFDVDAEGVKLLDDYDIYADVGPQTEEIKTFQVSVSDGELNIDFTATVDQPKVAAIEILSVIQYPDVVIDPIADQNNLVDDVIAGLNVMASGGNPSAMFTYGISGQPDGITINSATGEISGTVSTNAVIGGTNNDGVHEVTITVDKLGSSQETINFNWTITGPLIIATIDDQLSQVGETINLQAVASGGDNNEQLVYNISGEPLGLTINSGTGEITGTIDASASTGGPNNDGLHDVTVTASRLGSIDATTNFSWTVSIAPVALFRINTGGPELTHSGEVFAADSNFVGGKTFENSSATVSPMYQTERSADPPSFEYAFSVSNGEYEVLLHFAEIYHGASGGGSGGTDKRVFDVDGEGVKLLDDYDIYADVGPQTEVIKSFSVTVSDGELNLLFDAEGADGVDQPKVAAIEIFSTVQYPAITVDPIADQINVVDDQVSTLGVNASGGNPSSNFTYIIAGEPDGIFIEPTNGLIYGTIAQTAVLGGPGEDGVHTVTVSVSKPGSTAVDINFNWTVTGPQLPFTIDPITDQQSTVNAVISLMAHAMGGDTGEPITYSISDQPLGLDIDSATGEINGTIDPSALTGGTNNDGIHQVTVTADRLGSTSVQEVLTWTVTDILSGGVESFTLVDADTDQDLFTITDNMQIDLAQIEGIGLNIRANTNPTVVGSVDFEILGTVNQTQTDNVAPYSLFGDDNNGDYSGQSLPAGNYVLIANAYTGADKTGSTYTSYTINFSIIPEESCDWTDLQSAQVSRFESRSEIVGDNIYVFGGFMAGIELSTTTEIYNVTSDTWTSAAQILVPASHAGSVVVGTDIWLIGGFDETGGGQVNTNIVQIYDTANDIWTYGPSLPLPIASGEATIHDNKIYFFGGVLNDQQTDSGNHYVLDLNNIQAGWVSAAPLPTPRNHHSAATLNGIIYAIGGQNGHATALGDVDVVEAYNPTTNVWTSVASLPTNRSHFEPGTTIHNNKIMIVGGKMATASYTDAITEYDPVLDVWTDKECKLPDKLFAPVAHVYDNKLTVSGGGVNGVSNITNVTRWLQLSTDPSTVITAEQFANQLNQPGDDIGSLSIVASGGDPSLSFSYGMVGQPSGININPSTGEITGIVDISALSGGPNLDGLYFITVTVSKIGFDDVELNFTWYITDQVWHVKGEVENYSARHECAFVQTGDTFSLIGGRESNDVDVFNYTTGLWNPAVSTSSNVLNHFQGVYYQGYVWVIGAFTGSQFAFPDDPSTEYIWLYDPVTTEWMQGPEIPVARRRGSTGLVMYNDKFYLIGGNTLGHNGGFVPWFDEYDPQTGVWTTLSDAPHARDHFQAALVGDKVYVIGGAQTSQPTSTYVSEVDVYDFTSGVWSTLVNNDLPTPRDGASIAIFNDDIIVIGGGEQDQDINGQFIKGTREVTEAFDVDSETWYKMPDNNLGHRATQAIVSGNGIHITAGQASVGGFDKNMEYYGQDNPTGSPIVVSQISVPNLVTVASEGNASFDIGAINGDTGIFITSMEITGADAPDFSIASGEITNGLLLSGSTHTINIALAGTGDNRTASLVINYSNSQTAVISLTNSPLTSPGDQSNLIGDNVSLQIVVVNDGNTYTFNGSDLPEGLSIDETTGLISGTVTGAIANSPYTSRVGIVDTSTSLEVSFVNFQWEVIDSTIITLQDIQDQINYIGDAVLFTASASGGDEAFPMVYSISGEPHGVSIDDATGEISGTIDLSAASGGPNGDGIYTVIVTASRVGTNDVQTQFTWTVSELSLTTLINSGGSLLSYAGEDWIADQYGSVSNSYTRFELGNIGNTENDELYKSQNFSPDGGTLTYEVPVTSGSYDLNLHFAELYYFQPGRRVFDIDVEGGQGQVSNYDVYVAAGGRFKVVVESYAGVVVTDGFLTITLTTVTKNAIISGIEILPAAAPVDLDPVVDVGADQELTLPTNSIVLNGLVTDDGTIQGYQWTQESGPSAATLSGELTADLTASDLEAGSYVFRLTATDDILQTGFDEVMVTVTDPNATIVPVVSAGTDQLLTLPTNSVVLNGTASDPDGGTIQGYQWTQESGPSVATLSDEITPDLTASDLVEGSYVFRLTVTDDDAETSFDDVNVIVSIPSQTTRINSGGSAYNYNSDDWIADQYGSEGNSYARPELGNIGNTDNDELYKSQNFSPNDGVLSYEIPVTNGSYDVNLHFAELYYFQPGRRVFDIDVEGGQGQISNYDVYVAAGGRFKAVVESYAGVVVTDGFLTITLTTVTKAAIISGIEVLAPGGGGTSKGPAIAITDFEEVAETNGEETTVETVILYPNPAISFTNIEIPESTGVSNDIYLFDMNGRIVRTYTTDVGFNTQYELDLSSLPIGIYTLHVMSEGKLKYQQKLIKKE